MERVSEIQTKIIELEAEMGKTLELEAVRCAQGTAQVLPVSNRN